MRPRVFRHISVCATLFRQVRTATRAAGAHGIMQGGMDKPTPEQRGETPADETSGRTRRVRRPNNLPHLRPADHVIRIHRGRKFHLRRVLGIPGLYSVGYGDVGSSIFYALGLVVVAAAGATPIALAIAGLFFVFTALTYAEGASMFPEAGGSSTFARQGFNDLAAFIAGWSLMFGYIITISISIYTVPHYLAYFWPVLGHASSAVYFSLGATAFLMAINVLGIRESSGMNFSLTVVVLIIQALLIITGMVLFFEPGLLWGRMSTAWPSVSSLVFGVAIATVAYTGIESVSQLAGEARDPQRRVPKALIYMIFTVLIVFAGISLTAFSVTTPADLANNWSEDAVAGVANGIYMQIDPQAFANAHATDPTLNAVIYFFANIFRSIFRPAVAVMGAAILLIAANAGLLGISRITFSLAEHHSLPPALGRIHKRFKTPYIAILCFGLIAMVILLQGLFLTKIFEILGGLYAFGSMVTFAIAHASIIRLRVTSPNLRRPFKLKLNVRIKKSQIPITAVIGLLSAVVVWVVVVIQQPYSRYVGIAWMGIGLLVYFLYRRAKGMHMLHHRAPPPPVENKQQKLHDENPRSTGR